MRDLYKRIGVSPDASVEKIREAVNRCVDESLRRDAERVLLDPESRGVYDRNLVLLKQISVARDSLGILKTANWDAGMRAEFAGAKAEAKAATKGSGNGDGCGWALLAIVGLAIGSIVFHIYNNSEESQYKRAMKADTVGTYSVFLAKNPNGRFAKLVKKRIQEINLKVQETKIIDEWRSFDSRIAILAGTLNPHSSSQHELVDLARKVITEVTNSDVTKEAKAFLTEARFKFEGQIKNAETAIYFYRLFPDVQSASILIGKLESIVESGARDDEFQAIQTFLNTNSKLPGITDSRIDAIRRKADDKLAERYRDFDFVRKIDTKEAYDLYLKQVPSGPDADRARRRIIDLEVDEISKGDVGELPELEPMGYSNTSQIASVEITNDTAYSLTVRYSGRDSQKHVIAPRQKRTFQIRKGDYRVTATVDSSSVRPYAGTETITYDQYGVSFYIITTRF
jgi:hypothetical protein